MKIIFAAVLQKPLMTGNDAKADPTHMLKSHRALLRTLNRYMWKVSSRETGIQLRTQPTVMLKKSTERGKREMHVYECLEAYMTTNAVLLNICLCRMDTTLVNFSEMKWERGDITFLFIGERERKHSFYVLDNKFRIYQKIRYQVAVLINI